jgi:hypothetical protein
MRNVITAVLSILAVYAFPVGADFEGTAITAQEEIAAFLMRQRVDTRSAVGVTRQEVDATPTLTVLFDGRTAAEWGLVSAPTGMSVSKRGNVVISAGGNLFDLASRSFLTRSGTITNGVYSPSGALFVVSGRSLGYYASGEARTQVSLPENGMKLAAGRGGVYLFGGDRRSSTGLYFIDPAKGYVKLCDLPLPIEAASVAGDKLFFSVANDIYRFVPGSELQLICRLPGPAITSLSAAADETVYFTAGRTLYFWRSGQVSAIAEDIGDMVTWHSSGLHLLDTRARTLVRLEKLP